MNSIFYLHHLEFSEIDLKYFLRVIAIRYYSDFFNLQVDVNAAFVALFAKKDSKAVEMCKNSATCSAAAWNHARKKLVGIIDEERVRRFFWELTRFCKRLMQDKIFTERFDKPTLFFDLE